MSQKKKLKKEHRKEIRSLRERIKNKKYENNKRFLVQANQISKRMGT
jgi:hypothetical protein